MEKMSEIECPKCGAKNWELLPGRGIFGMGVGNQKRYKCVECGVIVRDDRE